MNAKEAAVVMGVHHRTMIRDGRLKAKKNVSGEWEIGEIDIIDARRD